MSTSPIIPVISNYPTISISRPEDLEGKSHQELWLYFCTLSNHNVALLNTINQLNGSLHSKEDEINILRCELSDMAVLKSKVASLQSENSDLTLRLKKLEEELGSIKEGLSAREIGSRADTAALKKVFPNVTKKPFSIRSLANFVKFIENPEKATSDCLCPNGAAEAWSEMLESDKNSIKGKLVTLFEQYPGLLFSIKTLKDNWKVVHTITSMDDSLKNFRDLGDDTMVDAIEVCAKLINYAVMYIFSKLLYTY